MAPIAACAAKGKLGMRARVRLLALLAGSVSLLVACSSSAGTGSARQHLAAVKAGIIKAWLAAENAFYRAEADPNGAASPALAATMVDPELSLVRRNLEANKVHGLIGRGTWDLGTPSVVLLKPNDSNPSRAVVKSCIDDSAILISQQTGQPAQGVAGTPDWVGEDSTMVQTVLGRWKLQRQEAVGNPERLVACAGI